MRVCDLCLVLVFAVVTVESEARADCNPLDFHDKTVAFRDIQTRLLYAKDVSENRSGSDAGGLGIDFFDIVSVEGNSRSNYVSNLRNITNIDFKESDRQFLYLSEMSDNEKDAYLGCLKNQNIFIVPSVNAASSPTFSIKVSLRAAMANPKVPITIGAGGATITGISPGTWKLKKTADGSQATGQMALGSSVEVRVARKPAQAFDITVTGPNESQEATLPKPPTKTLIEEIRYSAKFRSSCSDCTNPSPQAGSLTIHLPSDEIIKPRSENVDNQSNGSAPTYAPHAGAVYANLNRKDYSQKYESHDLVVPVSVSTTARSTTWCGTWAAWVKVFVAVPINANSSGRISSAPDLKCP